MQIVRTALAAAMLIGTLGVGAGAAAAAPIVPRAEIATADLVQDVGRRDRRHGRGDRDRDWDDDDGDRDEWRERRNRRHGRHHGRQRCYTAWEVRWGYYGPEYYPVKHCSRGRWRGW